MKNINDQAPNEPHTNNTSKLARGALNIAAGAIPFAGGTLAAVSAAWSEHEQDRVNEFLKYRQQLLDKEIKEQLETINEIMQRLAKIKQDVSERIKSSEFQSLVEKCFSNWSDNNTKSKREFVRNILVNAASTNTSPDDVIRLFIDWINQYSEFHFQVMACIYQHQDGISRSDIWQKIGKQAVREDSAEADLYKLLIRDLSTGGIIRQHRPTDYHGNFVKANVRTKSKNATRTLESAFDISKQYVLTDLGQQFVHYAMTDLSTKIEYKTEAEV